MSNFPCVMATQPDTIRAGVEPDAWEQTMIRTILVAIIAAMALSSGTPLARDNPSYGNKGYVRSGFIQINFLQANHFQGMIGKSVTVFGYTGDDTFKLYTHHGRKNVGGNINDLYFKFSDKVSEGKLQPDGAIKLIGPGLLVLMSGKALTLHHGLGEDKAIQVGRDGYYALENAKGGRALLRIEGTIHEFRNKQRYLSAQSIKIVDQR